VVNLEMTRLLERLAMDKVSEGDDAGARQVLQVRAIASRTLVARYFQEAEVVVAMVCG
jgi:hypothetical protein